MPQNCEKNEKNVIVLSVKLGIKIKFGSKKKSVATVAHCISKEMSTCILQNVCNWILFQTFMTAFLQ